MPANCRKGRGTGNLGGGFTLIELLVVIAIIAVVLAIMMPGLRLARAVCKKAACQSNLKQLAYAWNLYLNDFDGYFYQQTNAHFTYGGWKGIVNLAPRPLNTFFDLNDTLDNDKLTKVFSCPSDTGGVPWYAPTEKAYTYLGTSYFTNLFLIGPGNCTPSPDPRTRDLETDICSRIGHISIGQVTANHASVVLMGDEGWIHQWRAMTPADLTRWEQQYKVNAEWHLKPEYYNMVFLDGHTAYVKIRRAYYITEDYTVLPFKDLFQLAYQVQGP